MSLAHILLVDDEVHFVETMVKRLKKRNFDVKTAHNGLDALAELEKYKSIEVVILDVKMPGMDGVETLIAMKEKFSMIEVIMLTGHATVESAVEGLKKGAYDYLMKPCDIDQLTIKVLEAAYLQRKNKEKALEDRLRDITQRGR